MNNENSNLGVRALDGVQRVLGLLPWNGIAVKTAVAVLVCAACLQWTRLSGVVKGINLKDSTVTLQNRDGDLLVVPVDYQVKMIEKHGEMRDLKHLALDEKITLVNTPAEKPREDSEGLAPPDTNQR